LAAAGKGKLDRPPCICPGGMMNMVFQEIMEASGCLWPEAHEDPKKMAGLAAALYEAGGFENYGAPFCMTVEAEAMGAAVNMGSLVTEPHITTPAIANTAQWEALLPLELSSGRVKVVLEAIALLKKKAAQTDVPIIGNLTGPVSVAGSLVDMSVLLKDFRKRPAEAEALLDFITGNLIVFGQGQLAAGADAICIAEPSGTGEILGPRFFREYTVKYINRILDALKPPVAIVHICGDLHSVFEILPELHCHIFSFDSLMKVAEMKTVLPQKALMGNLNTHALGTMTPDKVARLARACREHGADVVAPACGLPTTTPLKNVQAMVGAVKGEVLL